MQQENENTISANASSGQEIVIASGSMVSEKYKVGSLIGKGGMGAVYRAQQVLLGKDFALKVLDLHNPSDTTVRRFHQEARTTAQLQHPNLVEVRDFGVLGVNTPYLVMDLVEGETLSQTLKKCGALTVDYALALGVQVAFGLMYAHDKGVVHRDIKPANIMLLHPDKVPAEGTIKILDFGIAKLTQSEGGEIQSLTQTGEVFGSPLYMSPEQCKGTSVDRRADIYSLGCVLFECLTGSPPFYGDTAMATMLKRLSEDPPTLREGSLGREFSPELERVIRKMLAVNPDDRYQEMGSLIKDLMALQKPENNISISAPKLKARLPKLKVDREQVLLMLGIAIMASIGTAIIDRFILFPAPKVENDQQTISTVTDALESRLETPHTTAAARKKARVAKNQSAPVVDNFLSSQQQISDAAKVAGDLESGSKVMEQNPELHAKSLRARSAKDVQNGEVYFETARQRYGDDIDGRYPYLETLKDKAGGQLTFINFPVRVGTIKINTQKEVEALGRFPLPEGAAVNMKLNRTAGPEPELLKNLTSVNFYKLDYGGNFLVTDEAIQMVKKLKSLRMLCLGGCEISKLKPVYDLPNLVTLETATSKVPSGEILKVKRLGKLTSMSLGPVDDPEVIFNHLAKTNHLRAMRYIGSRFQRNVVGKGLTKNQTLALSKLTTMRQISIENCPDFNDERLNELLTLQNMECMFVKECGLTPKSIAIFQKFKKLRELNITAENWSEAEKKRAMKLPCSVTIEETQNQKNAKQTELLKALPVMD